MELKVIKDSLASQALKVIRVMLVFLVFPEVLA
jgi:hypothetical protein